MLLGLTRASGRLVHGAECFISRGPQKAGTTWTRQVPGGFHLQLHVLHTDCRSTRTSLEMGRNLMGWTDCA